MSIRGICCGNGICIIAHPLVRIRDDDRHSDRQIGSLTSIVDKDEAHIADTLVSVEKCVNCT